MSGNRMDRRGFWREVLRSAVGGSAPEAAHIPPTRRPAVLRPPGALDEEAFRAACVPGCRLCTEACPVFAVVPSYDPDQPGGGDGRPYMLPDRQACILCGLCMHACPTGALVPTDAQDVRIGRAVVRFQECVRAQGEDCHRCAAACPVDPIAIDDEQPVPGVIGERCTGCGLCAEACPPRAISVVPRA